MRYFSRIRLDVSHPRAAEALQAAHIADAYRDHQWLWRFFSTNQPKPRDFVFRRMDPEGADRHPIYYVVSKHPPVTQHPAWTVESREYSPKITAGERFSFELRANPVVTRGGQRHDVVMDGKTASARRAGHTTWTELEAAKQTEITELGYAYIHQQISVWLDGSDKQPGFALRHGFSIARSIGGDQPALRADAYRRHRLADKDSGARRAWFTSIDLSGDLVVTDETLFRSALYDGVGHAKAFGCGLLLIRRM